MPRGKALSSPAEREACSSFHELLVEVCFILKEVPFSGLLRPLGEHHFYSKITDSLRTPVGLLSSIESHTSHGGPLCLQSLGQHTVRYFRRAPFPEHSNSIRTTFLGSPTCPGSLRHCPRLSCPEKTVCLEFIKDLVPEVTLFKEKYSILPCCVAHRARNVRTCLEVRP